MLGRYRLHVLLGASAILVWLNLRAPEAVELVQAIDRKTTVLNAPVVFSTQPSPVLLPTNIERPMLDLAERDPFVVAPPPPAPVVVLKAAPPPPVQVIAPPPPAPPPLNLRFAGRMTAPDGSQMLYVLYGESSLLISVGQSLPNGYRVDAIGPRAVDFSYLPMNTTARLDLPEPPKYETR